MEEYNPDCLEDNIRTYDEYLKKYSNSVYRCAHSHSASLHAHVTLS